MFSLLLLSLLLYSTCNGEDTPEISALLSRLHPGITQHAVRAVVAEYGHGRWIVDSHTTGYPEDPKRIHTSEDLIIPSPEVTLTLSYEVHQGKPRDLDPLVSVRICRFTDLCSTMDPLDVQCLRYIQMAPSITGEYFNPCALERSVNGLYPYGKDRVLRVMRQYVKMATDKQSYGYEEIPGPSSIVKCIQRSPGMGAT